MNKLYLRIVIFDDVNKSFVGLFKNSADYYVDLKSLYNISYLYEISLINGEDFISSDFKNFFSYVMKIAQNILYKTNDCDCVIRYITDNLPAGFKIIQCTS